VPDEASRTPRGTGNIARPINRDRNSLQHGGCGVII
jgi:hypothetical protein